MKKAFTLIEILIVIAIIGILAVAILIALDPVEQTDRAKDVKLVSASGEIRGAINRYYAGKLNFPWCQTGTNCTYLGAPSACTGDDISGFTGAGCASEVLTLLQNSGELKNVTPDSRLQLSTTGGGTSFVLIYDPYSKSQSTQYAPAVGQSGVYTDDTCGVVGNSTDCQGNGTCPYCLF